MEPPADQRYAPEVVTLLGCYHPSQQNTFTGKLTVDMIDAVFSRAAEIIGVRPRCEAGHRHRLGTVEA